MKLKKVGMYPEYEDERLRGTDYAVINLDAVSSISGFDGKYTRVTMMGGEHYNLKGSLEDIMDNFESPDGNNSEY